MSLLVILFKVNKNMCVKVCFYFWDYICLILVICESVGNLIYSIIYFNKYFNWLIFLFYIEI